jgi:hypothetical protein
MVELPENVKAWYPPGASPGQAVGLFLRDSQARPEQWFQYRELLADRVQWLLENSDPSDLEPASDKLESVGLLNGPLSDLPDLLRAGLFDAQLALLGVRFPNPARGRLVPPEPLKEVGLLEWASSMVLNEPDPPPPSSRRR